jgi:hypothetical protein
LPGNWAKLLAKYYPTITGNGRHFAGSFSLFTLGKEIPWLTELKTQQEQSLSRLDQKKKLV